MITLKPWAVYNEIEDYAADWLENLIALGAIAPGIVDRRSIVDVRPDDYRGFRQAHFFAGVAVWSYALRRAGVSDDTALWTGSCPCQPFSAAGAGGGVDDERHLWPHWFHLIGAARPPRIYGEQVASKDGLGWLDLVSSDLEGAGYSIWAVDTCSAGSGAPHIRQRLRFCADDLGSGTMEQGSASLRQRAFGRPGKFDRMDDSISTGLEGQRDGQRDGHCTETGQREGSLRPVASAGGIGWVADDRREYGLGRQDSQGLVEVTARRRLEDSVHDQSCSGAQRVADNAGERWKGRQNAAQTAGRHCVDAGGAIVRPSPTNGFWRDADWLFCRDAKWRPVEPFTFPLVDGSAFRVGSGSAFEGKSRRGMLKGYGNAIDAEATIDFIEATLEPDTITLGEPAVAGDFEDLLG